MYNLNSYSFFLQFHILLFSQTNIDLNNIDIVSNQDGDPVQVKPHVQTYIHKLNMGRKNKTANNGFGTRPRGFFGYAQTPSATAF